jgi:hypothetical protein
MNSSGNHPLDYFCRLKSRIPQGWHSWKPLPGLFSYFIGKHFLFHLDFRRGKSILKRWQGWECAFYSFLQLFTAFYIHLFTSFYSLHQFQFGLQVWSTKTKFGRIFSSLVLGLTENRVLSTHALSRNQCIIKLWSFPH